MKNKLFACLFFFHVCASAFSSEIALTVQHLMETINDIKLKYSSLNTTNGYEFETFERINNGFTIMDKFIDNIIDGLCENQSTHIALPLAYEIKYYINFFNSKRDSTYDIGMKHFYGIFQYSEELNFLFDVVNELRWILANFPLVDTNAWVMESGLNVSYNKIKKSISILDEIDDVYFRIHMSNPYPDLTVIIGKLHLLLDIANDNSDSIFSGILMHELNAFEKIIAINDDDAVFMQSTKLYGLCQYINFIVSLADKDKISCMTVQPHDDL